MSFLIASLASAAIVLVSPFMGQLQSFLRRSLSTRAYVLLFGVGVLAAVGAAIVFAFLRIRERRRARFALLVAALVFGGGYMWLNATPFAEVNAVERVHFVEYGLIAFLFYRAFRSAGDFSIVVVPLLLAFMVGTFDEWLQWFIPVRVGEAHDVFLNLASIACGLLFALALQPPEAFSWRPQSGTWRRIGVVSAAVWIVFALFVSQVHLGYENHVDGIGAFRSHYTVDQLIELQKERRNRWDADPPRTLRRLSQEDQYLDEGIWHIRRRNLASSMEAWHENLILERFFAPVIDIPTYASPNPNRWPIEQRQNMEASVRGLDAAFVSTAEPYPIVTWPKRAYWAVVGAVATALLAIGGMAGMRSVALLLVILAPSCSEGRAVPTLDIATTTSVQNSGLLDTLLPAFTEATVRAHAAGSGRALQMLAEGTAALVISHAPQAEARFLREHPEWRYQKLAFNRFIIVGPREDPAGIAAAADAAAAFARIVDADASFVSRGDESGTHEREQLLWAAAGKAPRSDRLLISGGSMAQALRLTDEKRAYTLSDEATFQQLQEKLSLVQLFDRDPILLNTYAVIHPPANRLAERFAEWLAAGRGRELIAAYRVNGRLMFTVWPEKCAGNTPDARPCS